MKDDPLHRNPAFRKKVFILSVACLFLVLVVTSIFGKKGVMDIHRTRLQLAGLEAEVKRLDREKARLEAESRELETNPKAVEKEARGSLWLIKPGEKVIVVPKDRK